MMGTINLAKTRSRIFTLIDTNDWDLAKISKVQNVIINNQYQDQWRN